MIGLSINKTPSPVESIKYKGKMMIHFKRDDLIHPFLSGNKYRKLVKQPISSETKTVITFGGAFSNHLLATAIWAKSIRLNSVGLVRTDQIDMSNPTLLKSREFGMELIPIDRKSYASDKEGVINDIINAYPSPVVIPEGGSNEYALLGFEDVWSELQSQLVKLPPKICCCYGTGATSMGLLKYAPDGMEVNIFPAIRGLQEDAVQHQRTLWDIDKRNYRIYQTYDNSRYASVSTKLIAFIDEFFKSYGILLDPIYTGKMMAQIDQHMVTMDTDLIFYHSGGVQGWLGYFYRKEKWKTDFPELYQGVLDYLGVIDELPSK